MGTAVDTRAGLGYDGDSPEGTSEMGHGTMHFTNQSNPTTIPT